MQSSQSAAANLRLAYCASGAAAPAPLIGMVVHDDLITAIIMMLMMGAGFANHHAAQSRKDRIVAIAVGAVWTGCAAMALATLPDPGTVGRAMLASTSSVLALVTFLLIGVRLRLVPASAE